MIVSFSALPLFLFLSYYCFLHLDTQIFITFCRSVITSVKLKSIQFFLTVLELYHANFGSENDLVFRWVFE